MVPQIWCVMAILLPKFHSFYGKPLFLMQYCFIPNQEFLSSSLPNQFPVLFFHPFLMLINLLGFCNCANEPISHFKKIKTKCEPCLAQLSQYSTYNWWPDHFGPVTSDFLMARPFWPMLNQMFVQCHLSFPEKLFITLLGLTWVDMSCPFVLH